MKPIELPIGKPSHWQLVFMQSKANGASYNGERLPRQNWAWPKDTYFQRRFHSQRISALKPAERSKAN